MYGKRKLILTCVGHLLASLLFLKGFFPSKSYAPGRSSFAEWPPEPGDFPPDQDRIKPEPLVAHTVLLVIDALREDFVFGVKHERDMPFLHRLMANGEAFGIVGRANQPTVTLPRIKALMTGTIPSFLDVVLNFGSTELLEDNLVTQALDDRRRIVFYGDDTWINLFPRHFVRSEGTTSFFVNDFTEVDANVTRNVRKELLRDDWDLMILHYLGLDHIGHVWGPQSVLVAQKLREMDDVIELIYSALKKRVSTENSLPPLLVICGDHGMSESGSHGGASPQETDVPILFASSSFQIPHGPQRIRGQQIDLVPTLSVLLGLPTPINNIGKIISGVLSALPPRQQLYQSFANAYQVARVARQYATTASETYLDQLRATTETHKTWLSNSMDTNFPSSLSANEILYSYGNAMNEFRQFVTINSLEYDVGLMCLSVAVHWVLLLESLIVLASDDQGGTDSALRLTTFGLGRSFSGTVVVATVSLFVAVCLVELTSGKWPLWIRTANQMAVVVLMAAAGVWLALSLWIHSPHLVEKVRKSDPITKYCLLVVTLHAISLASTSFIEEEHQTYYYLTTTVLLAILVRCARHCHTGIHLTGDPTTWRTVAALVTMLVALRLSRSWNSTGDKWAHLPDIGDWLNQLDNRYSLSAGFAVGVVSVLALRWKHHQLLAKALLITIGVTSYAHRAVARSLFCPPVVLQLLPPATWIARLAFVQIGCLVLISARRCLLAGLLSSWCMLGTLLLRPHNVPLLALSVLQQWCFTSITANLSTRHLAITTVLLAQTSFFLQGNANSLTQVDVTGGYVGMNTYRPLWVAVLLTCSTYCLPVLWLLGGLASARTSGSGREVGRGLAQHVSTSGFVFLACRVTVWCTLAVVALVCRYHLFVWSVFAPKLMYEGAATLLYVLVVLVYQVMAVVVGWGTSAL